MRKAVSHPDSGEFTLTTVLEALSDPIRRAIVQRLAPGGERSCSTFHAYASKTNLSYHLGRLRAAGIIRIRPEGTRRMLSLRSREVDARFPGLLSAVLIGTRAEERRDAPRKRKRGGA